MVKNSCIPCLISLFDGFTFHGNTSESELLFYEFSNPHSIVGVAVPVSIVLSGRNQVDFLN